MTPRQIGLLPFAAALVLLPLAYLAPEAAVLLMLLLALPAAGVAAWELATPGLVALVATVAISPEYHLPLEPSLVIALQKGGVIALSGLIVVQRGFSGQFNGPALSVLAATALTFTLGRLHPLIGVGDLIRSLIGTLAPFVMIWVRTSPRWHDRGVLAVAALPALSVVFGLLLQAAGPHNLVMREYTGALRLQGASIPAFMALLGEIGTYAGFAEYARTGRPLFLVLSAFNVLSVVATGTRVPMLTAVLFCAIVLFFGRGERFGFTRRTALFALGMVGLGLFVVVVLPGLLERTFTTSVGADGLNLSGRDLIWPVFIDAIRQHPLFGQGVGTGRILAPEEIAKLIGTAAVHNEYLRLGVDLGMVGVALLFLGHFLWFRGEWPHLNQLERVVVVAFSIAFPLHSITDNTLIAPQAVVLYFWLSTWLQRARVRAQAQRPRRSRSSASSGSTSTPGTRSIPRPSFRA
jgi:O-antigen ligase